MKAIKKIKNYFLCAILMILGVFFLSFPFFLLHGIMVEAFFVKNNSMDPVLKKGSLIIANTISDHFHRDDIVIFRNPYNTGEFITQKVIGLPGENIKIHKNRIYINDLLFETDKLLSLTKQTQEYNLDPDQYFVVADKALKNTKHPDFATVSMDSIKGKYLFKIK